MFKRTPQNADLEKLLRDLGSNDSDVRYRAFLDAQALPVEQLLELAKAEAILYQDNRRFSGSGCLALVIMGVVPFLISKGKWSLFLPLLLMTFLLLGQYISHRLFEPLQRRRSMVRLLQSIRDPRCVGATALLYAGDSEFRASLANALKSQLPQLRTEDAWRWSKAQKTALLKILECWREDGEMTLSVLKALEHIGDESALRLVHELALFSPRQIRWELQMQYVMRLNEQELRERVNLERRGYEMSSASLLARTEARGWQEAKRKVDDISFGAGPDFTEIAKRIAKAAADCLTVMQARLASEKQGQILLRPAEMPAASASKELLRPAAGGANETPPEQLLRPTTRKE